MLVVIFLTVIQCISLRRCNFMYLRQSQTRPSTSQPPLLHAGQPQFPQPLLTAHFSGPPAALVPLWALSRTFASWWYTFTNSDPHKVTGRIRTQKSKVAHYVLCLVLYVCQSANILKAYKASSPFKIFKK